VALDKDKEIRLEILDSDKEDKSSLKVESNKDTIEVIVPKE
jgi:hypothetical protein